MDDQPTQPPLDAKIIVVGPAATKLAGRIKWMLQHGWIAQIATPEGPRQAHFDVLTADAVEMVNPATISPTAAQAAAAADEGAPIVRPPTRPEPHLPPPGTCADVAAWKEARFPVGSEVILASGGHPMTVLPHDDPGWVNVIWSADGKIETDELPPAVLRPHTCPF